MRRALPQETPCKSGCRRHKPTCPTSCTGHARWCPLRQGGGLVLDDVKTKTGRRTVALPGPLLDLAWCSPRGSGAGATDCGLAVGGRRVRIHSAERATDRPEGRSPSAEEPTAARVQTPKLGN